MRVSNQHNGVMRVLEARMEAATLMRHRSSRVRRPIPIPVFRPSLCDTLRFTVKYEARTMYNIYTCIYMPLSIRIFLLGTRFFAPSILNYPCSCIIDSQNMYILCISVIFSRKKSLKFLKNLAAKNVT